MICSCCGLDKDISMFASRGGGKLQSFCKACKCIKQRKYAERTNARSKSWRINNPEKVKAFNDDYSAANAEHNRMRTKEWYAAHKDDEHFKKRKAIYNKQYMSGIGRDTRRQYDRAYGRRPHVAFKMAARAAVRDLVVTGICQFCGSGDNIHKHHPDYRKPLEIIELCADCHRLEHKLEIKHGTMATMAMVG